MTHKKIPPNVIPDWLLEVVQVMQTTYRVVHNIDSELRHGMTLEHLDCRLQTELQYVRDALGAVKISLSLMDFTARKVLKELAEGKPVEHPIVTVEQL